MSRAEGQELEKRLGDVPRSKIRNIVDQVARAAIFLRDRGLCHRDLKAANVFISDDFDRATVLDLSVLREIDDPIGLGTDHGNQLPVVATSRYTPPEYLFRLQDPSPEFWHGVDAYQLGGILHDLIMREPMFSNEYASSSENRYRFAWIVATVVPVIRADDVDADLVLLARKALDKKWERRRLLRLNDFLAETGSRATSLAAIGLAPIARPVVDVAPGVRPSVARELARSVEERVLAYLSDRGLTATHHAQVDGGDLVRLVTWSWKMDATNLAQKVELRVRMSLIPGDPHPLIAAQVAISLWLEAREHQAKMALPEVSLANGAEDELTQLVIASLGTLSSQAFSVGQGET